ncbi:MAG: hypothetical protein ACP5KX_01400 [Caldisericia bacterium]
MKKIVIILTIFFVLLITINFNIKKSYAIDNLNIKFILKDSQGNEISIEKGKGKFNKFKYNLIESDGNYKLIISGKGAIEFEISFKDYEIIFPEKNEIFISPMIILKDSENDYLMFSVPPDNLYYFECSKKEGLALISFNIYINKKENLIFNVKKVNSLDDGFDEYFKIYKEKDRKVENGGLITPDTSYTKIRASGINNFNIKYRIVNPEEEKAVDRINEASFFGIQNLVILNPVRKKFENLLENDVVNKLYFDKDNLSKIDSIVLLTSGLKDGNGKLISFEKKSKPTYKLVSGEPVVDYKENSFDKIFLLNPSPNFLRNKGISSYSIYYNRYIYPLNISIIYYNNESGFSEDKKSRYSGFALDFSDVSDTFNYNKVDFGNYPTSYLNGKECQFYLVNLYDFLKSEEKKNLILSINPRYFQLIMNSDLIYKEINDLNEISNFPIERALIRNRPINYSFKLSYDEINEVNLNKIFNFSLLYGIYPTFSNPDNKPFSIWDYQDKLNELMPFIKYYDIINQIEKSGFKPKSNSFITNGSILRFGNYPEIYLTIKGDGLLTIDKKSLNIDDNFKIIDLIKNSELEYKEEGDYIVLKITDEKVIKIFSENEKLNIGLIINKKVIKFDMNFFSPLIFICLLLLINKYKIKFKINPYIIITLIFLSLLIIKFFLNITSPYFLFLSIGIISLVDFLYETGYKKSFLFNFSLIFFIVSFIYHLLTKSQINIVPPFYLYFDLYYFVIVLFLFFYIFNHFKWNLIFDFIIFISFFTFFFLTNLITTPFYTPPSDLSFLINFILLIFITFIISFKNRKFFILFIILSLGFIFYLFWDKIYYFLLLRNIFVSFDFITYFLTLFLVYYLFILLLRKNFKTKPNLVYFLFFIILILNSLTLNNFYLNIPNRFPFLSSISRLIFYIIIIVYLIYFTEMLLTKKEE